MTILAFCPMPLSRLLIQLIRSSSLVRIAAVSSPRETPLDPPTPPLSISTSFLLRLLSTLHIPFALETQLNNIRSHNILLAFSESSAICSPTSCALHIFSVFAGEFRAHVVSGVGEGMRTEM